MARKSICTFVVTNNPGTSGGFGVGAAADAFSIPLAAADNGNPYGATITQTGVGAEVINNAIYDHGTLTLSRGTLHASTTGARLNFTAGAVVEIVETAADFDLYDAAQHAPTDVSASTGFKGYFCRGGKGATSNFTLTAGRHTLVRFDRTIFRPINAVLARVSTAGAGGTQMQAVVYRFGAGGLPEFPALAVSSLVDASTTGDKVLTLPSAIMPPGVFAVGIQSDGAPVINGFSGVDGDHGWGIGGGFLPISFVHHVGSGLVLPTSWSLVPNTGGATYPGLGVRCVT